MLIFLCTNLLLLKLNISKTKEHITLPKTRKLRGKGKGNDSSAQSGLDLLVHRYHFNSKEQDEQTKQEAFIRNTSVGKHSILS